jgi:hypothetical protein
MILSRTALKIRRFCQRSVVGVFTVVFALAGFALASAVETAPREGPINPLAGISIDNISRQSFLAGTMYLVDDPVFYAQAPANPDSTAGVYGYESKSPKRAFIQSFLIPGWGQWYNGSRVKPFVFLGLEAAGWFGVSQFHSNGQKKQNQYQKFADDPLGGWNYQFYLDGLKAVYKDSAGAPLASDTLKYRNPLWGTDSCGSCPQYTTFSHHIRADADGNPIKDQNYYENIGKYNQFSYGWRDFRVEDSATFMTPNRDSYRRQRADANREFSRASTVLILTIGNHLISAFEAALGAARHNKSMDQFGAVSAQVRLVQSPTDGKLFPKLYVGYRF